MAGINNDTAEWTEVAVGVGQFHGLRKSQAHCCTQSGLQGA